MKHTKVAKKPAVAAKTAVTKAKKPAKKYEHHPDHYNKSEPYLIDGLNEDLKDAWFKIRAFGASLGEQKTYASGRAIMFSKKVCYFFVRPKKSYLETVIFLPYEKSGPEFKSIKPVSKTKFAHTFRLVHSDQVEGELTDALREAFAETPPL
jgi:hypothetical protein